MRLEDYWGIGPKTAEVLAGAIGEEEAIAAIENGDVRALTAAGLSRGRATRILRHAHGGEGMALLATNDARAVYKDLLDLLGEYAVSPDAADRIRLLTPLPSIDAMRERVDRVGAARAAWAELSEAARDDVLEAFAAGNEYDGQRAVVRTALALAALDLEGDVFAAIADLDVATLESAETALAGLGGDADVATPQGERLADIRDQVGRVEDLAADPAAMLRAVQSDVAGSDDLREALARQVATEADVDVATVEEAMPADAADATEFVGRTLQTLAAERRETAEGRAEALAADLEADLAAAQSEIDAAREAVDDLALWLSLARAAAAFDLTPASYVADRSVLGVVDARNPFLVASGADVQPITYAVGTHSLTVASPRAPPSGDRVAVLTGANSGGKTTLLETLGAVQILAQMGLPVPAAAAEIRPVDAVVFHRRHASFNAGVLESTLRSVVPPLTAGGRTLMLVDEFEAITEPGSAADLLHGLVELTVEQPALGVFVTHLADDLEPLPAAARTDGIFAEGLTPDLRLQVDYQPQFETVGRSTPEFIVSRLVAEATDGHERAGYHALARAVGEQAVQRTLADARWRE